MIGAYANEVNSRRRHPLPDQVDQLTHPIAAAMPASAIADGMMGSRASASRATGGIFANLVGGGSRLTGSQRTSDPFDEQIPGSEPIPGIPDFLREGAPPIVQMPTPSPQPQRSGGNRVFGIIADTLAGAAGQPGMYAQNNYARQREERRRNEERLAKLYAPEQVGGSMVQWDGTGYKTLYKEPEPFEAYAAALGFKPGTPEYATAMEDYVLRSSGQSAFSRKVDLEGVRFGYRDDLQDQRLDQSNTNNLRSTSVSRENNIRSTSTSRDNNIRTTGQSDVNNVRTTNQSDVNSRRTSETARRGQDLRSRVRGRRVGGVPVQQNEPMARDKDGTPMVVRNGQWVRVQ